MQQFIHEVFPSRWLWELAGVFGCVARDEGSDTEAVSFVRSVHLWNLLTCRSIDTEASKAATCHVL